MSDGTIRVRGARTHNLRDLDLDLPRGAWTVVGGVSGSGKSSLVLDTLGAESRRRFLATSRRGGDLELPRPDVDAIEGLPPAVAAGFTARAPGPRETLGTVTEVTYALRALFARMATPHCPRCGAGLVALDRLAVAARLLERPPGTRFVLLASRGRGPAALADAGREGFVRVRVSGGEIARTEDVDPAGVPADARVEVVVDRLVAKEGADERFQASVDQALDLGGGVLRVLDATSGGETTFADRPFCGACDRTWPRLSTRTLSFESPEGACPSCEGRGAVPALDPERVLPRRLRLARLPAWLARALDQAGRAALARDVARWVRREAPDERARVLDLSEATRTRWLEGTPSTPGLLAHLARAGRWARYAKDVTCPECEGTRLSPFARSARLAGTTLPEAEAMAVRDLAAFLDALALEGAAGLLARAAKEDAAARLAFLNEVGLAYLAPARAAASLSSGELRRARLAAACAARMSGLLFLLDEPTAGLAPSERERLWRRLADLVREGNTVVSVEHDPVALRHADHVVEMGPGAGPRGGAVVASGPAAKVVAAGRAPLAKALLAPAPRPRTRRRRHAAVIRVRGARGHNLSGLDVEIPLAGLTVITGPSGAGKTTLLLEVLAPAVEATLVRRPLRADRVTAVEGASAVGRVRVARGTASRHPRASPGSVLGVLGPLQRLFAATLDARARGWRPSRFSRHVKGGRCEACRGIGERRVALRDLAASSVPCDVCDGTGFASDTRRVRVKGLSISDAEALSLEEAAKVFRDLPAVAGPLAAATDVGLGYVPLGEPTSRLSGGEALRLSLAAALGRGGETPTLYALDEPTLGLHPDDVRHLATVLLRLAAAGNAVVAVEHHPRLVAEADHLVVLGPGAGDAGGRLLYQGPPAGAEAIERAPGDAATAPPGEPTGGTRARRRTRGPR